MRLFLPALVLLGANLSFAQDRPAPGTPAQREKIPGLSRTAAQMKATYVPITGEERADWFAYSCFGPMALASDWLSVMWSYRVTRSPEEWGRGWDGYGKLWGNQTAGSLIANSLEAGVGAVWGEDPRYFRKGSGSFGSRAGNVLKLTFGAYYKDGKIRPAYARYAAQIGTNYINDAWQPPSAQGPGQPMTRVGWSLLGRAGGNAFNEFFPDVWARIRHKK